MKNAFRITFTFAIVLLLFALLPAGSAQAAGNDNNVEWDGAGHLPGSNVCGQEGLDYRYPPANPSAAQSVVVRERSYQFDLTGVTLYYTTNPGASVAGDWTAVALSWETNCGVGMDSWIATIPAQSTQVWYKIALTDGTDTDWVRTNGEGAAAVSEDEGGWTTGSTTITYIPQAEPTIVYVDDDFNSSTPGWGYDHFDSVQDGIDAVAASGLVNVATGMYEENVLIDKAVEVSGESQAGVIILPEFSNPDCNTGGGGSLCSGAASNIFLIEASDVTIHDLTLDGDNPAITSMITCGGIDIDARNGIIENYPAGVYDNLEVYNTTVQNIYLRGIYASSGGSDFYLHNNLVQNVQCENASIAIFNFGGSGVIADNVVDSANDAISANWSAGTQFLNNIVTNSGSGIHTDNAGAYAGNVPDLIQGNTVTCDGLSASPYGIWTFVTHLPPTVDQNTIVDCGVGLSAWGEGNPVVTQFTNNLVTGPAGIAGTVGAYITTDLISYGYADISVNFEENVISGFDTAIYLTADQQTWNPNPYSPMTVTATFFNNSITGYNVGLDMGTQGTYNVDVSANWWGTYDPAEVKDAVNDGLIADYTPWLETGTDTSADSGFQGDFSALWVDDDSPQTGSLGRIQEAVDMALPGGTVNVVAGTYTEQVIIPKDLNLLGAGMADTFIHAFASMPNCFTTSSTNRPVVCVIGADVTLDGFTIDGLGLGNSNNKFEGVAFRNAGGTVQNSAIHNIEDTPFSGGQHGVGVYAFNEDGVARTIHVLDNIITSFQKTAIALNAGDTTAINVDVQRNVITGVGPTTITAQNGIQIWAGLGDGLVADNTISGIAYDGSGWVATSILQYYSDLNITGNTITNGHVGIYNIDGSGLIADNTIEVIKTAGYAYGIIATDPPQAVPSPYQPQRKLDLRKPDSLLTVEVAGNTLGFVGADLTGSVAIEADGGYGEDNLSVNVHHNVVTGFDYGVVFYQCDGDCDPGVFDAISVVSNDLLDNTLGIYLGGPITTTSPVIHHNRIFGDVSAGLGLYSELTATVTAENNWWGCNEGPADAACMMTYGAVDADPWLVLKATPDPASVQPLGTSLVTADLIFNSDNADTSADGYAPDGILMAFTAPDGGAIDPLSTTTLNGAGNTTFTAPSIDQDYQVCTEVDNALTCAIVTVENVPPLAENDAYTTTEEVQLVVVAPGVLENDTDENGDALTVTLDTDVSYGILDLSDDGSFTYTPEDDFFGVDTFTYMANDGVNASNVATVTITVTNVNDVPLATEDAYNAQTGIPLVVDAPGVLENDVDIDGDALEAVLVTDVTSGTLMLEASGAFTYTSEAGFLGVDMFTYYATDGMLDSEIVTVTITVLEGNIAAVAVADDYITLEDNILVAAAPGVLENDTDANGDPLEAVLVTDVTSGTLTLEASGAFTYTPDADIFGIDSFTYYATDGLLDSEVVTVTITITPVNDLPVANDDAYSLDEDTTLTVSRPGVMANDFDIDGDGMTFYLYSPVSHGDFLGGPRGGFVYTPDADFSGIDNFTYWVTDGTGFSNIATVTFTVNAINDIPAAVDDAFSMDEDTVLTVTVPGVLANDTDIDGDVLTATLVTDVPDGTLVLNADGSFTYTPDADFFGVVTFTYVANDGTGPSNVVTVTITVNDVPDEPVTRYFFLPMLYKHQP